MEAEDADRAGDRRGVRHDEVGLGGDVVAAAGRDIAHRDDHGRALALEESDLARDDVAREGRAAGAVHAEHDRLDAFIPAEQAQVAREAVSADVARGAPAVHDLAFGVDDRDPRAAVRQGHLIGVAMQVHLQEGGARLVRAGAGDADLLDELVAMHGLVRQLEFHGFPGVEDAGGVDRFGEGAGRNAARFRDIAEDALPDSAHEGFGLFSRRLAHDPAEVRFYRGLILADLGHLHADAQQLQRVAVIHVIRGEALQLEFAGGMHVDLVRDAGEVVLALRAVLDPGDDGLAAGLEGGDRLAELGLLGDAGGERSVQEDAGDVPVLGRQVDCFQRAEEIKFGAASPEQEEVEAGGAVGGRIVDRQVAADDEHRLGLHGDCGRLMSGPR